MNEIERARISSLLYAAKASADSPSASKARLAVTISAGRYPTVAKAFYGIAPATIGAFGGEGTDPSLSASSATATGFAANVGNGIPPVGTYVIVHSIGGVDVFSYG